MIRKKKQTSGERIFVINRKVCSQFKMCASIVSLMNETEPTLWDDWFYYYLWLRLASMVKSSDCIHLCTPRSIKWRAHAVKLSNFRLKQPNCDVEWKDYNVWYEFIFMKHSNYNIHSSQWCLNRCHSIDFVDLNGKSHEI